MERFLTTILNNLDVLQAAGAAEDKEIKGVTNDSRKVEPGFIFVAVKGYKTDGHDYVQAALNNGAAAVVIDENRVVPNELFNHYNCVKILVKDSRVALSKISHLFYGKPSQHLYTYGITGTKGKSTSVFMFRSIIEELGKKCGSLGTIENYDGKDIHPSSLTTPESSEIHGLMASMVFNGCTHCAMEVSSHSLMLNRVSDIDFDVALFSNITSDHLDFHENFENYREAKKLLFNGMKENSVAVVNCDDSSWEYVVKDCKAKVVKVGLNESADYRISNIEYSLAGTDFTINGKYKLHVPLIGAFNAYNAGLVFAALVESGFNAEETIAAFKVLPQVPGRFEVVEKGSRKAVIDYSHTADSLKQALTAIQHINTENNPVFTVVGCGGDRDKTKRPIMGGIASEMSTKAYITSDNPRTEDPHEIIKDVVAGIKKENYEIIESREEAIKAAILNSPENSVILIAGKGHEDYQIIGTEKIHFSDKETAKRYLDEQ